MNFGSYGILELLFFKVGVPAQRGLQPSFATSLLIYFQELGKVLKELLLTQTMPQEAAVDEIPVRYMHWWFGGLDIYLDFEQPVVLDNDYSLE